MSNLKAGEPIMSQEDHRDAKANALNSTALSLRATNGSAAISPSLHCEIASPDFVGLAMTGPSARLRPGFDILTLSEKPLTDARRLPK